MLDLFHDSVGGKGPIWFCTTQGYEGAWKAEYGSLVNYNGAPHLATPEGVHDLQPSPQGRYT